MSNQKKQNAEKNNMGVIIGLGAALVVGAVVLCVALISVLDKGSSDNENVTTYSLTSGVETSFFETENDSVNQIINNTYNNVTTSLNTQIYQDSVQNTIESTNTTTTTVPTTRNEAVAHYEQLSKNGDNVLSDHYENEFIKMVSEKYNVDSELLVAIYSQPDTGNNFVLQFDGTRDSDGNIVKSPDTLEKVYQIDKARNVKIATGTANGNVGVSYAEGMLCFNMVKTLVMEQYPDYFTGLDN